MGNVLRTEELKKKRAEKVHRERKARGNKTESKQLGK